DALGIDGHGPVRHEFIAGRPDAEGCILDDEEPPLAVDFALDTPGLAVPQSRAALDIELPSEPRAHLGDHVSVARPERLGSLVAPPLLRRFIERAVRPIVEVTELPDPRSDL